MKFSFALVVDKVPVEDASGNITDVVFSTTETGVYPDYTPSGVAVGTGVAVGSGTDVAVGSGTVVEVGSGAAGSGVS